MENRNKNGRFVKGNTAGGRTKGSKNKATEELRSFINDFINDNKEKIQQDFDSLEPKERIDSLIKLLEYSLPKLQRTELTSESENKKTIVVNFLDNEEAV